MVEPVKAFCAAVWPAPAALPGNLFDAFRAANAASQRDAGLGRAHLVEQPVHRLLAAGHTQQVAANLASVPSGTARNRRNDGCLDPSAPGGLHDPVAGQDGHAALPQLVGGFAGGRVGTVDDGGDSDSHPHQPERRLVSFRRFAGHNRLAPGKDAVQRGQAQGRRGEHDPGQVVVLEEQRRLLGSGCQDYILGAQPDHSFFSQHGQQVVLVKAEDGGVKQRSDVGRLSYFVRQFP